MSIDLKDSSEWDSIISDKKLVAADFWAPWCPFCMRLKPVFESVADDFSDIKFVKINVDQQSEIASRYGIQGIPVIKFFCDSKEIGEVVGYVSPPVLKSEVDRINNNTPACLANTSKR